MGSRYRHLGSKNGCRPAGSPSWTYFLMKNPDTSAWGMGWGENHCGSIHPERMAVGEMGPVVIYSSSLF